MIDMATRNANAERRLDGAGILPGHPDVAWIGNLGGTDTVTVKIA